MDLESSLHSAFDIQGQLRGPSNGSSYSTECRFNNIALSKRDLKCLQQQWGHLRAYQPVNSLHLELPLCLRPEALLSPMLIRCLRSRKQKCPLGDTMLMTMHKGYGGEVGLLLHNRGTKLYMKNSNNSLRAVFKKLTCINHLRNLLKMHSQIEWAWFRASGPKSLTSLQMMLRMLVGAGVPHCPPPLPPSPRPWTTQQEVSGRRAS